MVLQGRLFDIHLIGKIAHGEFVKPLAHQNRVCGIYSVPACLANPLFINLSLDSFVDCALTYSLMKIILLPLVLALLVQNTACAGQVSMQLDENSIHENNTLAWTKSYEKGLVYEVYFRNLSRIAFTRHFENSQDPYERSVWGMFIALEQHSLDAMKELRGKYNVDTQPAISARIGAYALSKALNWWPEFSRKKVLKSANVFIPQLKAIKALGPQKDQAVLSYMVQHEQVLVDFLTLYLQGEKEMAKEKIETQYSKYYGQSDL